MLSRRIALVLLVRSRRYVISDLEVLPWDRPVGRVMGHSRHRKPSGGPIDDLVLDI